MKILIVRPISAGGVGNYYEIIRNHFRCEVKYIYIGSRKAKEKFFEAGIRILSDYLNFLSEIINNNYDLVHLNPSLRTNAVIRDGVFLLLSKLFRNKTIVFFHGWSDELESTIRKRYSKLFGLVFFSADAIIVLASRFKSALQDMGCTRPIFLETTLVPDEVFNFSKDIILKNDIREGINILFLSRIEIYKGVYTAINAYSILKKKYPSLSMTLAGDGSELDAVKEYIKTNNIPDIEILGWVVSEMKTKVFIKADMYLFPTHGEGMPISVLEAMAYGLPVITCPVGGIKDFFQNGKMGYLTEIIEPQIVANLCEILIKDFNKRAEISIFNRAYAREHFMASVVSLRLEAFYKDIVNKSG